MDQSKKFENQLSAKEVVESPPVDGKMSDNLPDESQRSVVSPQVYQPAAQGEDPVYEVRTESYEGIKDSLCQNKVKNTLAPSSDLDIDKVEDNLKIHESSKNLQKYDDISDLSLDVAMKRYCLSPYAAYLHGRFTTPLHKRLLKLESATDLFLDQEEGQWKMLDRSKSSRNVTFDKGKQKYFNLVSVNDLEDVIEPSYVILNGKYSMFCSLIQDNYLTRNKKEDAVKLDHFILVKNCLLDNLKVEVERRIGMPDSREFVRLLTYDLENFTDRVSRAVLHRCDLNSYEDNFASNSAKLGVIEGQTVAEIISLSLQDAGCVKKVLPLGVIVGSSLASLKNYFQVVAFRDDASRKTLDSPTNKQKISNSENGMKDDHFVSEKNEKHDEVLLPDINEPINKGHELGTVGSADGGIVVGAVTAALGASALLASNQKKLNNPYEDVKMPSAFSDKSLLCEDEITQEKSQNRLVSSLAEKAMSIAGPVVPTKDDGEVDHERLVTMLAGLGQKVGVLRLVGKVALLWGGMRGAISLTDRLISFLHIAERPLFQRLCGFVCMVLVLWSPVVIPLLPMLVQSCKTHTSNRIAEFVCLVGLYVAAMILVILWGKRIRNYDNPLQQYGLDLISVPRVLDFLKGLIGGITIVLCIHSVNALLGYSNISCSLELPSSLSGAIVLLKAYGNILILTIGEIVAATGISTVEELLFRSWLAEEAAADLGYPHSLVISGLLFALVQRSVSSVPFFMLLSLSLFGIKQRCGGQLAAPVGVRTGLMAANSIILHGNFLHYRSDTPFWLANAHPLHPFDGAVGIFLCAILAIVFYPKMPPCSSKVSRPIRD
ncbi:hypothetical protein HPP92_016226 [Vanilla planifolia]|uniref:Uncharacterized protein n=1 Tax=Vanilla planifolia TaxID=51239 RepID=A0A835URY3_VANPL|nr:hypothetical protein HPP92_016226 [Vanilla planifolia]